MQTQFETKLNEKARDMVPATQHEDKLETPRYPLGSDIEDAHTEIDSAITYLNGLSGLFNEYVQLQEKANVALYEFLQGIFLVVVRMKIPTPTRKGKALANMRLSFEVTLKQLKKDSQISFTSATSFEAKVLRYVCGKITPSREKAWVRVLKVALECEEVINGEVSFAAWLAREGGIYEVSNTNKKGIKPSERDEADIADAMTLIAGGWLGTDEHRHLVSEVEPTAKAKSDKLDGLMITLTYSENGGEPQKVIELHDDIAIERVLVLMGRKISQPMPTREAVLAEEAAKMQTFTQVTGHPVETHRM